MKPSALSCKILLGAHDGLKSWTNLPASSALSLSDVQNLGVNLLGHQRKIVSAAQQLRAHLTQGQVEVWNPNTKRPVLWISTTVAFLCLLCLVSATPSCSLRAHFKPRTKGISSAQSAAVCSDKPDTTTRRGGEKKEDRTFPASHSGHERRDELRWPECRSEWGWGVSEEEEDFTDSSMFFTRFHFTVVCRPLYSPNHLQSYLSPSLPLPSLPQSFQFSYPH